MPDAIVEIRDYTIAPEWREIWAKHPNPEAYLHSNVRFMKAVADFVASLPAS